MQTGSGDLSSIRAYEDRERQAKDVVTHVVVDDTMWKKRQYRGPEVRCRVVLVLVSYVYLVQQ
jgi:hypothetical protein